MMWLYRPYSRFIKGLFEVLINLCRVKDAKEQSNKKSYVKIQTIPTKTSHFYNESNLQIRSIQQTDLRCCSGS